MARNQVDPQITGKSSVQYEDMAQSEDADLYSDFFEVGFLDTEGPTGFTVTTYQAAWTKWHGYYRVIPEFAAVIDKFGSWTVGRGLEAQGNNKAKIDKLKGFGKDDFNSLLENAVRTMLICGDFYAEKIMDKQGRLTNLKPLNPGSIKIIADRFGLIKGYEQVAQIPTDASKPLKFTPDQMFHLAWNRIADEIHGIPIGEKMEGLLRMRTEAMEDQKVVFHRYVKPVQWIEVDTDNDTELNDIQTKLDNAYKKSENIIVPKGVIGELKTMSIPQYSTLDPLPWLKYLIRVFVTAMGMPEVIMGWGADTTEASSKIIYLAFQQTIERFQRYIETQCKIQLNIEFTLNFPASIEQELQKDEGKDSNLKGERKSETQP